METNERSQTFADHLENAQWAARQLSPLERQDPLGAQLASEDGDITAEELSTAIRQLKNKRAAVQIPAEYLKAVVDSDNAGDAWILKLMRRCWATKTTPESWHLAEVVMVFKKGYPEDCNNYRPISLVSVLYKVYAKILLNRLKAAGAEARLWKR